MRVLSLALLMVALVATLVALLPCMGILIYLAVPLSMGSALVGTMGLLVDRDPQTERARDPNTYLAALVGGILLAAIGLLLCFLGGGVA